MGWNVNDLTARTLGPLATFRVFGYVFAMDASQHVVFQGFSPAAGGDGHVHELFRHPGGWHLNDLTNAASAPLVTLFPTGYDFSNNGGQHVVYQGFIPGQGDDGHIHELYWNSDDGWQHNDLTNAARAPLAINTPVGHQFNGQRVFYEGGDLHIHGLEWNGDGWHHTDLSAATGASSIAVGPPTAYVFGAQVTDHVLYLGTDANIHELWWNSGGWHHNNLSLSAGGPPAADVAAGFVSNTAFTQHVAYRGTDGHVHGLQWTTSGWTHADLTAATGAPPAASGTPTGYVVDFEQTLHFDYTGTDGHVHELWHDGSGWHHSDLTAATGAPPAISDPSGYYLGSERTQHVFYISSDHHVVELWWTA